MPSPQEKRYGLGSKEDISRTLPVPFIARLSTVYDLHVALAARMEYLFDHDLPISDLLPVSNKIIQLIPQELFEMGPKHYVANGNSLDAATTATVVLTKDEIDIIRDAMLALPSGHTGELTSALVHEEPIERKKALSLSFFDFHKEYILSRRKQIKELTKNNFASPNGKK